jgi:hypothetical protein
MRKIGMMLVLLMFVASAASAEIIGDLSVEVINKGKDLVVTFSIYNDTPNMFIPDENGVYPVAIRSVYEPQEFINVELDGVAQAAVSQYISSNSHGVIAVKTVPVPKEMQSEKGIFLALLFANPCTQGEEVTFYYPGCITSSPTGASLKE